MVRLPEILRQGVPLEGAAPGLVHAHKHHPLVQDRRPRRPVQQHDPCVAHDVCHLFGVLPVCKVHQQGLHAFCQGLVDLAQLGLRVVARVVIPHRVALGGGLRLDVRLQLRQKRILPRQQQAQSPRLPGPGLHSPGGVRAAAGTQHCHGGQQGHNCADLLPPCPFHLDLLPIHPSSA